MTNHFQFSDPFNPFPLFPSEEFPPSKNTKLRNRVIDETRIDSPYQSDPLTASATSQEFTVLAEGKVTINGRSNFEGDPLNSRDDALIYAGDGFTFNGRLTLPVQRDEEGNPLTDEEGKLILVEKAVAVSEDFSTVNVANNPYSNLVPPPVVETQTVELPAFADLKAEELATRLPDTIDPIEFDVQAQRLNNFRDWDKNFPEDGTANEPTFVEVTNGNLNIPNRVDISNTVIVVEEGDINFNGSNHDLEDVALITESGNINLLNVEATDLSVLASNTINVNGKSTFAGSTLFANAAGNLQLNSSIETVDDFSVISQGNITYNGASDLQGTLLSGGDITFNGNSQVLGSIAAKGDITFNGGTNVTAVPEPKSPGTFAFSEPEFYTAELGVPVVVGRIVRTDGSDGDVSVTIDLNEGTATAGEDFDATSITIEFKDGERAKEFAVPTLQDEEREEIETVDLSLTNPTGGASLGEQDTATLNIVDDDSSSVIPRTTEEGSAVSPDRVDVFLPPGEEVEIEVTLTVPGNSSSENEPLTVSTSSLSTLAEVPRGFQIPLDVFLLQDLSGSFADDLPVIRELAPDLVNQLVGFQPDTRFGVGSFIDQPVEPFGGEDDYVYRTELPLTDNGFEFQAVINELTTGFGGDFPEAQLSALEQTALNEAAIGFRDEARRVAVLTTDAPFQEGGFYPTVDEIRTLLIENDIIPIFAVTSSQVGTYEAVVDQLDFGEVVTLSSNSSNLVDAILAGLEEVGDAINILPVSDDFDYVKEILPDRFEGIAPGDELSYIIRLESDGTGSDDSLQVRALGFGETKVNVITGLAGPFEPPLPGEPSQERQEYLDELDVQGVVTGGSTEGSLINDDVEENPTARVVGFREIQNPTSADQTWVVIHGLNSNPGEPNIAALIEAISENIGSNDRVLALDWREAAENSSALLGGNGIAATWIAPVAEFAARALQDQYGIDSDSALESLNLVGHSLGTFVSSEIGRVFRDGATFEGETVINPNGEGVRTITALDPASSTNIGNYDLDGRVEGDQPPLPFAEVSTFSRAFNGAKSLAGNAGLAVTADEAFQMDFGSIIDFGGEHGRVPRTFANLSDQPELIGDLLGLRAYESLTELPIEDFDTIIPVNDDGYDGILDVDGENQSILLIAQATTGDNDNIVIGNSDDNTIAGNDGLSGDRRYPGNGNDRLFGESGNDEIRGKAGDDILSGGPGNDRLFGDGSINPLAASGDDILYGGPGQDELTGGGGADTFVFAPGDGGSSVEQADLITDFELETDQIGLIDLTFGELNFQEVSDTSSAITTGGEFLASLTGVGVEEIQNPDFFVSIDESIFQIA